MRLNKAERIVILLAAAAVLFAFGYFFGRNSGLKQVTVQTAAPVQTVQELPAELPEQQLPKAEAPISRQNAQGELLDLNTADSDELQTLPGIGPVLAGRILAYRAEHGGFASVEEITKVSGIGETILEKIFDYVTVG